MKSQRIKIFIKISFLLVIFLSSCGIPSIIYLEPPVFEHSPTGQTDENEFYFEFKTSDEVNIALSPPLPATPYYRGFEIFYKIYESESDCKKEIEAVTKKNEADPLGVANYLQTSLKFKFLAYKGKPAEDRPLIPSAGTDRKVKFRLKKYSTNKAELEIVGGAKGDVLRFNGKNFSDILVDDDDVKKASSNPSANPDEYFVACFAVTQGIEALSPIYSTVVSLGYVKITKN